MHCPINTAVRYPAPTAACYPTPAPQACATAVNTHLKHQLCNSLQQLINRCQQVSHKLGEALHYESMDAQTSNNSFFGWIVSNQSYSINHQAAAEVDRLAQEARRINELIAQYGRLNFLPTGFDGNAIRNAENNEHSFLPNLLSNWSYSDLASQHTWQVIANTKNHVDSLLHHAYNTMNDLNRQAYC